MAARNHPVARATSEKSMRNTTNRQVAKLPPEEPDAGKLHVRVCEGASGQPLALLGGDKKEMKCLRMAGARLMIERGEGAGGGDSSAKGHTRKLA